VSHLTGETEPLYSSLGDDPDLGELVEMFVDEMPDRVAALLQCLNTSDWDTLRRTAHQLKGAAGSYGFDSISLHAADVEAAVRQCEPEQEIRHTVDVLVEICRRARAGPPI
jgi:HPt (histidine-containing phosphotransfer) domain-containing protein